MASIDRDAEASSDDIVLGCDNLADYIRFATTMKGGDVVETAHGFAFKTRFPLRHPMVTGWFPTDRVGAEGLDEAYAVFGGGPFFLWAREWDVELQQAAPGEPATLPAIMLLEVPALDDSADLRQITTLEAATEYLDVLEESWGYSELGMGDMIFLPPEAFLDDRIIAVGLYEDGRMVAGSTTFMTETSTGSLWTATRKDARGRGLGTIVCTHAMKLARDRGASKIVAQASQEGLSAGLKMGWHLTHVYHRFAVNQT
jgi:GNAT superfamily N-acetyltransferase